MQKRMARLVAALDEPTRKRVLETMGRECAKESQATWDKFKGKPEEFMATARQQQWIEESSEYDAKTGRMRIVGPPKPCSCAFVRVGLTPPEFCQCTIGWLKEAYSAILGRPVDAEIEASCLRGAQRCISHIRPSQKAEQ
jgi:predicted ArsR family transcriptional regulator